MRILKDFKGCVLEVRILKGLWARFAEVRIVKDLGENRQLRAESRQKEKGEEQRGRRWSPGFKVERSKLKEKSKRSEEDNAETQRAQRWR